jgi:hypothetical protein
MGGGGGWLRRRYRCVDLVVFPRTNQTNLCWKYLGILFLGFKRLIITLYNGGGVLNMIVFH